MDRPMPVASKRGPCYLCPVASATSQTPRAVFLTGGTGFLGRRLLIRLTQDGRNVLALVRKNSRRTARGWLGEYRKQDAEAASRIRLLTGDVTVEGIFDDQASRARVLSEAVHIVHCAAATHLAVERRVAFDTNVGGSKEILDLAAELPNLERLMHVSAAAVAGDHRGRFSESMLLAGQRYRDRYSETKMLAERKVQAAMGDLPITVVRPSHIVGQSDTGEVERVDGFYHLLLFLLKFSSLPAPLRFLPVAPGGHKSRIDVVPVDFVVDAMVHLLTDPGAEGKTLHLTDPFALTVREFLDLAAERLGFVGPLLDIPGRPLGRLFRSAPLSGIRMILDQAMNLPPELLAGLARPGVLDTTEAERLLRPAGLQPPPLASYFDHLVDYTRNKLI
jgi:thioester reductase-like protein